MTRIATLDVGIAANSERLNKELRRSRKDIAKYGRAVGKDLRRAGTRGVQALAALTAAFVGLSKAAIESASEIEKVRLSIGLTAEETQQLQHVFRLADIDPGKLGQFVSRLGQSLFDLELGLSTQVDAFNELGLAFEDFQGKSIIETIDLMNKAFREMEDPLRRQGVAAKILGARYAATFGKLIQTDIDAVATRISRLGGIISDEAATAAAQWADEMATLTTVIKAQFTEGLIQTLGGVKDFDKEIEDVGKKVNEFSAQLVLTAIQIWEWRAAIVGVVFALGILTLVSFANTLFTFFGNLIMLVKSLAAAFRVLAASVGLAALPFTLLLIAITAIITGFVLAAVTISKIKDEIAELFSSVGNEISGFFELVWLAAERSVKDFVNDSIQFFAKEINRFLAFLNDIPGIAPIFGIPLDGIEIPNLFDLDEIDRQINEVANRLESNRVGVAFHNFLEANLEATSETLDDFLNFFTTDGFIEAVGFKPTQLLPANLRTPGALAAHLFGEEESGRTLTGEPLGPSPPSLPQASRRDSIARRDLQELFRESLASVSLASLPGSGVTDANQLFYRGLREARNKQTEEQADFAETIAADFSRDLHAEFSHSLANLDFSSFAQSVLGRLQSALAEGVTNRLFEGLSSFFETRGFSGIAAFFGAGTAHTGGLIEGRPGQEIPIIAQAGELVLTPTQQSELFQMLDSAGGIHVTINATGDVTRETRRALLASGREVADVVQAQFAARRIL